MYSQNLIVETACIDHNGYASEISSWILIHRHYYAVSVSLQRVSLNFDFHCYSHNLKFKIYSVDEQLK